MSVDSERTDILTIFFLSMKKTFIFCIVKQKICLYSPFLLPLFYFIPELTAITTNPLKLLIKFNNSYDVKLNYSFSVLIDFSLAPDMPDHFSLEKLPSDSLPDSLFP